MLGLERRHNVSNGCKTAYCVEQIGPRTKRVRLEAPTFPPDFFKAILEHNISDITIGSGESEEKIRSWEIPSRQVHPDALYRRIASGKKMSFGIRGFFEAPSLDTSYKMQKSRMIELTGEQLTGKNGYLIMRDILKAASSAGLSPCLGLQGFELEELRREEFEKEVCIVTKSTLDSLGTYVISLRHDADGLHLGGGKAGVDLQTLSSEKKLIFTVFQAAKEPVDNTDPFKEASAKAGIVATEVFPEQQLLKQ